MAVRAFRGNLISYQNVRIKNLQVKNFHYLNEIVSIVCNIRKLTY